MLSGSLHREHLSTLLAFSVNDPFPNLQIFHAMEKRQGSSWSLDLVLSVSLLREAQSKILVFFCVRPFTWSPTFPRNGELGLGSRCAEEKRFILKLGNRTFRSATYGTSIHDFTFYGERSFTWSPKFIPKWINLSRNTLRRKDKVHIEAYNLYFQVRNFGNLYQWF